MGLSTLNYKTYEKEVVKGMQDCMFYDVNRKQIDNLKVNKNIKCVMTYRKGIERNIENIKINPVYYDYEIKDIQTYKLLEGNTPIKENEIVIDVYALKELGKSAKVGEELEILGEKFIISGLLNNGKGLSYPVLFSKEYSEKGNIFENSRTDALIKVVDNMKIPSTEYIKNFFFELGKENDISRKNVNYNDRFVNSFSLDPKEISYFLGLSIVILVISGIVIYSIFYLSVSSKVREYAQLRTIGMSKKQMKKMIKIEGLNYCKLGITLGVITGGIIAYFVVYLIPGKK
jgi:putative ABC transport system permease protein